MHRCIQWTCYDDDDDDNDRPWATTFIDAAFGCHWVGCMKGLMLHVVDIDGMGLHEMTWVALDGMG